MRLLCLCTLNCECILTSGSIQPMVEIIICRRYEWYICKLDAVVGKVCSPNHCVLPLFKLIHWDELIFMGRFWNYNLRSEGHTKSNANGLALLQKQYLLENIYGFEIVCMYNSCAIELTMIQLCIFV